MGTKKVDSKVAELQAKLDEAMENLHRKADYIAEAQLVLCEHDGVPLIGAAKAMVEDRDRLRVQLEESKYKAVDDRNTRRVLKAARDESTFEAAQRVVAGWVADREELLLYITRENECECERSEPHAEDPEVLDDLSEAIGLALGMHSVEESAAIVARLRRVREAVRGMEDYEA